MGWNSLSSGGAHPILKGIEAGEDVYFVHSYHFRAAQPSDVLASVDYGGPITAIVARDNIIGTQFHPEKSGATGLKMIENFLRF